MSNDFNRTNKHRRKINKKNIRRYARGGNIQKFHSGGSAHAEPHNCDCYPQCNYSDNMYDCQAWTNNIYGEEGCFVCQYGWGPGAQQCGTTGSNPHRIGPLCPDDGGGWTSTFCKRYPKHPRCVKRHTPQIR